MLLQYYMSGVWLHKEEDIYYSHTSADSHAFYLMALCNVYRKTKDPQTLGQLKSVADLLLCLENSNKGGNPGWGLGAEYINKLTKNKEVIPSSTTYTYTSCIAARALLTAYEITGDTIYLQRCAAWRQCFFNNIGLHPENGCCHYADHKSYHDIAAFVPNVTPLFMGFLAEYARVTGLKEDKPFLARLCRDFMALEKCGNWYYSTGRGEDLMHLALIAEGLHLTNSLLGPVADTKDVINTMLGIMFNGWSVNRTKKCLGTANWGPAGALSVFLRYGLRDHVAAGVDFLKKKSELMFYNIRTASLYAKFLSEL